MGFIRARARARTDNGLHVHPQHGCIAARLPCCSKARNLWQRGRFQEGVASSACLARLIESTKLKMTSRDTSHRATDREASSLPTKHGRARRNRPAQQSSREGATQAARDPSTFSYRLSHGVWADDERWDYDVPGLPPPAETDDLGLVKIIAYQWHRKASAWVLRYVPMRHSRATRSDPLHRFLTMSFASFHAQLRPRSTGDDPSQATDEENAAYILRVLTTGVVLNGVRFHFYGHSPTQLKSRTCLMYAASPSAIEAKIEAMADFSELRSVAKKARRIGLLFTPAKFAFTLDPNAVGEIDDIRHGRYTFTDGCGVISDELARRVAREEKIIYRNARYVPSVFQIRYRGYKGVLMRVPKLPGAALVQFRPSMRKFTGGTDHALGVVKCSRVSRASSSLLLMLLL